MVQTNFLILAMCMIIAESLTLAHPGPKLTKLSTKASVKGTPAPFHILPIGHRCDAGDGLPCKENLTCHFNHCVPVKRFAGLACGPIVNQTANSHVDPVCSDSEGLMCVDRVTGVEIVSIDDDVMKMNMTKMTKTTAAKKTMVATSTKASSNTPSASHVGICAGVVRKVGKPCGNALVPPVACGHGYNCMFSSQTNWTSGNCVKISGEGQPCGGFIQFAPICGGQLSCVGVGDLPGKCTNVTDMWIGKRK